MKRRLFVALGLIAGGARGQGWNDPQIQLFRHIELDSPGGVRELLRGGMNPNGANAAGQLPLHWALMHESPKVVSLLIAFPGIDLEAQNANGERPLMLAALRGRLAWAQALMKAGASVEPQRGTPAWNALHYACSGPDQGVSAWLLDQGADVNARSPNGSTPLMMAVGYGSVDSAELLLQRGADRHLRNDLGLSAWDFARKAGRTEAAERLGLRASFAPAPDSVSGKR